MMSHGSRNLTARCFPSLTCVLPLILAGCSTSSVERSESRSIDLNAFAAAPAQPPISDDRASAGTDGDPQPIVLGAGGSQSRGPEQLTEDAGSDPKTDYVVDSLGC